ncbi:acyl-CoA/acyl-ACP dehydrogenase [Aestuariicella sp. G3-2]|uniref:acyl-CoA dehydrogenase family protein n=1 Tax=Pseudomaricurvus albidus TaxID=2842452 RepID=UPI001C0C6771|nr:acyl-CoA dehydrogenase family protein [Aestuariicella albida]MBU3069516.1 acyl-CoA/acyl-ACP dehydrogenase [Aestuariicella albida]
MAVLTEEQVMLREMASSWAVEQSPVTAFRRLRDSTEGLQRGFSKDHYRQMAEMGWAGILVPEEYGGSSFGYLGLGLVLEQVAQTLTASPLMLTAGVGVSALMLGGNTHQREQWLPAIVAGEVIVALAVDEGSRHHPERIECQASVCEGGWSLSGRKAFVLEGGIADVLLVAARTEQGVEVFWVPAVTEGVIRHDRHMADSRNCAEIELRQVVLPEEARLAELPGEQLLQRLLDCARAGAAAEMLGMATQAFAVTLDYLKTREQFDEIIARFQALQHRMANLYGEIELMRSAVEAALSAIESDDDDASLLVSLAKATACDTLNLMTREMVQLHGGIGMTDEHDAGFYLKRARVLEAAWGNASFHRDRFARLCDY